MKSILFEIGTEEIPAKFLEPAAEQLSQLAQQKLDASRIAFGTIRTFSTPRRLTLYVSNVTAKQKDLYAEVRGPAQRVAFDEAGNPTRAALGFARSQGVEVSELVIRETENGPYVYAIKTEAGLPTEQLLQEILPQLVAELNFPKPMAWGSTDFRFARPIRWMVALFGSELIDFEIAGVRTSRCSRGHRFLGNDCILIPKPEEYLELLRQNFVIADSAERRQLIMRQFDALAQQIGGSVVEDEELLTEVVNLLEYPTAFVGQFSEEFLAMPEEVIITPMKDHQRYFPVKGHDGNLLPVFVGVRNGDDQHLTTVTAGNERVLHARLADARFFYEEDQKRPLDTYIDKLKHIVFQEQLGTLYDKAQRIKTGVLAIAKLLNADQETTQNALRAAELCKADLVTHMVYEFPELQGIMGEKYALLSGENAAVARAISEHYLPRHADDTPPTSMEGILVGLADKLDTIVGCFAVGIEASGSQDPYGLRRQAAGICHTIISNQLQIDLYQLIEQAYNNYSRLLKKQHDVPARVYSFFEQRIRTILNEQQYSYDVIDAVLSAGYCNLTATVRRAAALQNVKDSSVMEKVVTAYTRAARLAHQAETDEIDTSLFERATEHILFTELQNAEQLIARHVSSQDFEAALKVAAQLETPIKAFFDDVMVMAEDDAVRRNRLTLLRRATDLIEPIADLNKIVL